MAHARPELPHLDALDGLRGLAVLGILLFHDGRLAGGWLGVDLFFVLSGFLITSLLWVEYRTTSSISLAAFWSRRARRLLPALLALLLAVALYAALLAEPAELARLRGDVLSTLFYVANWHAIAAQHDYWAIFRAPSPLDHSWSLAIEEQLYLLWPPLMLGVVAVARRPARALLVLAAALALASALWMALCFDPAQGTARVYFGTDTRLAAPLLGAALAIALRGRMGQAAGRHRTLAAGLGALGLAALIAAAVGLRGSEPLVYRGGLFVLALCSVAVIAALVLAPDGPLSRALGSAPLRGLGIVSYGVYLWHWPLYLVLTPERTGWEGWPLTALRLAATLAVATLSYHALEQPVRRWRGPTRRLVLGTAVSSAAVLGAIGLAIPPALERPDPTKLLGENAAALFADVEVLLIGDSMAADMGRAFVGEARRRGLRAQVMGAEGCSALRTAAVRLSDGRVLDVAPCLMVREQWIAAADFARPAVVIVLEGWSGIGDKRVGSRFGHPCEPDFDAAYRDDLDALVRRLARSGAATALVATAPPYGQDLSPRFAGQWGTARPAERDARFRERATCLNAARREVARATGAVFVDLERELCPGGACTRQREGTVLRPDGLHFSGPGAGWAARWLLDRVPLQARDRGPDAAPVAHPGATRWPSG